MYQSFNSPICSAALLLLLTVASACTKDNVDVVTERDLVTVPDTVLVESPIALSIPGTETTQLTEGQAYRFYNGENVAYLLASENVTVECPGSLKNSWAGGEELFQFQFIETPDGAFVFSSLFNTEYEDRIVTFRTTGVPPNCLKALPTIDYEVGADRITGTITGEYFIDAPNYVPPFDNCDNFIEVGTVEVSFDLPIVECN